MYIIIYNTIEQNCSLHNGLDHCTWSLSWVRSTLFVDTELLTNHAHVDKKVEIHTLKNKVVNDLLRSR